jgi:glutamate N-acetyltransferase / amino-acid N-acetyltransferase
MAEPHLLSPKGFTAAGVFAGIKTRPVPDVGLLVCDGLASAAAMFTTNKVIAAPIVVGRQHIKSGRLRGIVVNAGNANACTGKRGEADARTMCEVAAEAVGCMPAQILPSSTGIIGCLMPMDKVVAGIEKAGRVLGESHAHALQFADAILTTDLCRKSAGVEFKIGRKTVRLAGVCKGSGMIGPRLGPPQATMLAYLTTDAKISPAFLRKSLAIAAEGSFNAVTVDDHTSTNDTVVALASGFGGVIDSRRAVEQFQSAMNDVCQSLAYQIAADGEGATKVVRIEVSGAVSEAAAKAMARAIAVSPLVKCAMHGNDPNWGRIVSAAGMVGVPFDPDKCVLKLQNTTVFHAGRPAEFSGARVSEALKQKEVRVELNCRMGRHSAVMWTCDLSKDYVTINAHYHT